MARQDSARASQFASESFIGRTIDYLFGRNALIGVASLMLLAISGYATWSGMSDFIVGVSQSSATSGRALPGGLSVTNEALVIAVVVALTFLMWLALRESFGAGRTLRERLIVFPLYLFLALWSVGFGYGFWWSLIAGEAATRASLSGLQEDARDAGGAVSARLDAVKSQLDAVVAWSETQMAREEASGGSCGIASGAGQGPLYNARKSVRDAVANLRDSVDTAWIAPVEKELADLKGAAQDLSGATFEERQQAFETKASAVRSGARRIAARSNELGSSTASQMRALSDIVTIAPGKVGFSCYDPTLSSRLRQAAEQAAQPVVLDLRQAEFTEGPAGVANAVKTLWQSIADWRGGGISYAMAGFQTPDGAAGAGSGGIALSGRDLIALLATLGIDLGLFALTALNPPRTPPVRHIVSETTARQVREAIATAIARAPGADLEWVRRHFIYHRSVSYFVIPNLFSGDADDEKEASKALAMNQLAGVFDDLNLVRWPTAKELEQLRKEEEEDSTTDLTDIRKKRLEKLEAAGGIELDKAKADKIRAAEPVRNHGLFSKAERALRFSGWSEQARRDIEIYRLVDTEGLTPLLMVLNERGGTPAPAPGAGAASGSEAARADQETA